MGFENIMGRLANKINSGITPVEKSAASNQPAEVTPTTPSTGSGVKNVMDSAVDSGSTTAGHSGMFSGTKNAIDSFTTEPYNPATTLGETKKMNSFTDTPTTTQGDNQPKVFAGALNGMFGTLGGNDQGSANNQYSMNNATATSPSIPDLYGGFGGGTKNLRFN